MYLYMAPHTLGPQACSGNNSLHSVVRFQVLLVQQNRDEASTSLNIHNIAHVKREAGLTLENPCNLLSQVPTMQISCPSPVLIPAFEMGFQNIIEINDSREYY